MIFKLDRIRRQQENNGATQRRGKGIQPVAAESMKPCVPLTALLVHGKAVREESPTDMPVGIRAPPAIGALRDQLREAQHDPPADSGFRAGAGS